MSLPGYLLHETADIAVIATVGSRNPKTADMVNIWILTRNSHPSEALRTGADSLICGDCPLRGKWDASTGLVSGRTCYVAVWQAPSKIWRRYRKGGYPYLPLSRYPEVFCGRPVRAGAYGEPTLIPLSLLRWIAFWSDGMTGYTHAWRTCDPRFSSLFMASVESEPQYREAKARGWRTFRVRPPRDHGPHLAREIVCPASPEGGRRVTCGECLLCSGSTGPGDPRKDIVINSHGAGRYNLAGYNLSGNLLTQPIRIAEGAASERERILAGTGGALKIIGGNTL